MKKYCTGFLIIAALVCSASLFAMKRSVSVTIEHSDLLAKLNREEGPLSPKSTGMEMLLSCKSGTLKGVLGVIVIKEYLKSKADLTVCDEKGSALMWASYFGLSDIVGLLLEQGASCDVVSKLGYTPLHAAAQEGHHSLVTKFVDESLVSIDRQAACGSTALHLAAQAGWDEIVFYLIEQRALTEVADCIGRTALHLASLRGHLDVCRMLILANAQVNARDVGGLTPLHMAAYFGHLDVVAALLEAHADCTALTAAGESANDYAMRQKHRALFLYLQRFLLEKTQIHKMPDIIDL